MLDDVSCLLGEGCDLRWFWTLSQLDRLMSHDDVISNNNIRHRLMEVHNNKIWHNSWHDIKFCHQSTIIYLHFSLSAHNVAFPNSATLTEAVSLPCFETADRLLIEGLGDLSAGPFRKRSIVEQQVSDKWQSMITLISPTARFHNPLYVLWSSECLDWSRLCL